jgi:catechol 2,3-dioxygenase-like lactoylglutathione lyase family enzyme
MTMLDQIKRNCITVFLSALFLFSAGARVGGAQSTMPFDHVHIAVPDPNQAAGWYAAHLGGTFGITPDRVTYGETIVAFLRPNGNVQPRGASSVVAIGISFPDLQSKVEELKQIGAVILEPPREVPGWYQTALIRDPWGTRIELVEDSRLPGFHHVRVSVPDPEETPQWLRKMFGGERGKLRNRVDGVRYGSVWVPVQSGSPNDEERSSSGGAIDHLGWRPENVDTKVVELRGKGATIVSEPRAYGALRFAFVEAPPGLRIELTQQPVQF